MDFINIISIGEHSQTTTEHKKGSVSTLRNISNQYPKTTKITSQNISWKYYLKKIQGKIICANIFVKKKEYCQIKIILIDSQLIQIQSMYQKSKIIKFFLKTNLPTCNFCLKIDPISKEYIVSLRLQVAATNNRLSSINLLEMMMEFLSENSEELQNYCANILFLINKQLKCKENDNEKFQENLKLAKELKIYAKSSNYYAWNIIENTTKQKIINETKKQNYEDKKSRLRKIRASFRKNILIENFKKCYIDNKHQSLPFFCLKIDQDEQLKSNYLSGTKLINKNSRLIDQIEITEIEWSKLLANNNLKIQRGQNQKLQLSLRLSPILHKNNYQRLIVQKLPNIQFIGLPKYYILKNTPTNDYIITNCSKQCHLQDYINRNSQTISFNTKIFLLSQIATTMKYMRDNNLIYHNLTKKTVNIKKKLIVKLTDLSNAYNEEIAQSKSFDHIPKTIKQNCVTIFPYVSNIKNKLMRTIDDERSDSYSLGVLTFEIIENKKIFNIKQSTSSTFSKNEKFLKLSRPLIFSHQKLNYIGNNEMMGLYNFILQSIYHKIDRIEELTNEDPMDQSKINLNNRTYLDWHLIITKHLINNYQC